MNKDRSRPRLRRMGTGTGPHAFPIQGFAYKLNQDAAGGGCVHISLFSLFTFSLYFLFLLLPLSQFHFRPLSWSRFTFPPLSTHATFDPAGALIRPCSNAATGAAAAPSTTSLQCDMIQSMASKISLSGNVTISSTKRCTTEKVFSPTRFTRRPSMMQSILSSVTTCPASTLFFMPGPSDDSTPMILIFGFEAFSAMETSVEAGHVVTLDKIDYII